MSSDIPIEAFSEAITDLIQMEVAGVQDTLDDVLANRANQYRDKLRLRSPKDTGDYAKGWRVKTVQRNHERVKVIYNAEKPWLTFILEFGTSEQRPVPHIRPALEETMDEIIEELVNRL